MKNRIKDTTFSKRKLYKWTSSMALLVVLLMVFSSVSPAIGKTPTQTPYQKTTQIKIAQAHHDAFTHARSGSLATQRDPTDEVIKYHSGFNNDAIGLTAPGTWEGAMRLTPTELGPYNSWYVTSVNWYFYESDTIDGSVKIYGAGDDVTPGTLLVQVPFTVSGSGLKNIPLDEPLQIDASQDLWVSIELVQVTAPYYYPFGIDAGPAVDGKGDWIYLGSWSEAQTYGLDYNWVLEAVVAGTPPTGDVGIVSIDAPVGGTATGAVTPQATIKNFGIDNQTNVPVDFQVTRYGTPYNLFADGFETYIPGYYTFPAGWTVLQTNPTSTWFMTSSGYPEAQETGSNNGAQDEWLKSTSINCVGQTSVKVEFSKYFYVSSTGGDSTVTLYGSTDGGTTWPITVASWTVTSSTAESIDISSWAAGQANVKLAFRFQSNADTYLNDYFYFDNFFVGTSWGPFGDNPPQGWTITTNEPTPVTWDNNNWHRYAYGGTQGNVARIYWSPIRSQDDSIISPGIDCSALSTVTLKFWHYFYYYSSASHAYVYGSIDGGATWPNLIASFTASDGPAIKTYDISSWAAGQSNVKIRFEYVDNNGEYWYVDDFSISSGSTTVYSNSFEGNALYSTTFSDYLPDNWGGWTWTAVTGTSTGNKWMNVLSGSSPTCMPHDGSRMTEYNSFSATSGNQARLSAPSFDASSAEGLKLKFWMFHDATSYQTNADNIQVVVSTDGTTWTPIGDPFYRSCTLQGMPLTDTWAEHIVDLSPYIGCSTVQVGFLATSAYGNNMYIDLVNVFDPGYATEYLHTAYVSLAAGQTQVVTFDDWTPDEWHTLENADMMFDVKASTNLAGDTNPTNDMEVNTITLHFPYFHDVFVNTIVSPSQDGQGKTLPVEMIIANQGQYQERDFFANMQIGQKIYDVNGFFTNFETDDGGFLGGGNGEWAWGVPTSGPMGAYSGSKLWATSLSGNYITGEATLDSGAIIVPTGADLTFWHWYDTEASYDGYNVKISTNNGATWSVITPAGGYTGTANTANPLNGQPIWTGHVQKFWEQETFDLAAYEGQSIRIRFDFGADTSVFYPGAYIDDVLIGTLTITLNAEYNESYPQASWIQPGDSIDVTLPDWTPAALAAGISGDIEYGAIGQTLLPGDDNTANDQMLANFVLSYRHDVGVKTITSPSQGKTDDTWIHIDDGTCVNAVGLTNGGTWETAARFTPDELAPYAGQTIDQLKVHFWGYDPDGTPENPISGNAKFYDAGSDSSPGTLLYTEPFTTPGEICWFYINLTTPVTIDGTKDMWISTEWVNQVGGDYPAGCDAAATVGKGDWGYINGVWYELGYGDWDIQAHLGSGGGGGGQPPISIYIAPGQPAIAAIVNNIGTFPESDMTATAQILSYVTDPNGTQVYADAIGDISLAPLGGEQALTFASYDFQTEGNYGLFVSIPLGADDAPGNNVKAVGIGVDATPPVTTLTVSPMAPDGSNGWYVHDVTLTLAAKDNMCGVSSIMYSIDGGADMVYTAPVKVTTDGNHTISYYAVDKVGNKETAVVYGFNIDKTFPMIELNKEILINKIRYTADCLDNTSGMDYVEFTTWGATQFIDTEAPYVWILSPIPHMNLTVRATAYDKAGNSNFMEAPGDLSLYLNQVQTQATLKNS